MPESQFFLKTFSVIQFPIWFLSECWKRMNRENATYMFLSGFQIRRAFINRILPTRKYRSVSDQREKIPAPNQDPNETLIYIYLYLV